MVGEFAVHALLSFLHERHQVFSHVSFTQSVFSIAGEHTMIMGGQLSRFLVVVVVAVCYHAPHPIHSCTHKKKDTSPS